MPLTDLERQMCTSYIKVHGRKIGEHMRKAGEGISRDVPEHGARELALSEARGVVAALERLIADDGEPR